MTKNKIKSDPLNIEDLVRYLSHLAKLHKDPRTGNPELSLGLRTIVKTLRCHSNKPLKDLEDVLLGGFVVERGQKNAPQAKIQLPSNLKDLTIDEVNIILEYDGYTKTQLIELGVMRFGISHSKLASLNKSDVIESVRAALEHENSLGVISQEARRGGNERSS